jgi:hypothetical protein
VAGITHPYLNVGRIEGGTNTNVVPGKVLLKLDRRMIPEEDPVQVEATLRGVIEQAAAERPGVSVEIRRLLLARALQPLPGNAPLVQALQRHGQAVFGETIPAMGTPLYTDVRLYGEAGVPGVIYGAGPRTVLESNASVPTSGSRWTTCAAPEVWRSTFSTCLAPDDAREPRPRVRLGAQTHRSRTELHPGRGRPALAPCPSVSEFRCP